MPPSWKHGRGVDKKRQRVERYRLLGARAKAFKEEVATSTGFAAAALSRPEPSLSSQPELAADAGKSKKKQAKVAAAVAARRSWEASQAEVEAARQAELEAQEERRRQQEAARQRRKEQVAKLNKRTKRGQPVLGFMVERYLDALQRKG